MKATLYLTAIAFASVSASPLPQIFGGQTGYIYANLSIQNE